MPKQETHLFLYNEKTSVPYAVYIHVPRVGSIPFKIEPMSADEVMRLHKTEASGQS